MSRRRAAVKRAIEPDPQYKSVNLAKFINMLMWNGKKALAEKIVYGAIQFAAEKRKMNGLKLFDQVIAMLEPIVEVKSRRVGGATYAVPIEIRATRRTTLAMRWLIQAARAREDRGMMNALGAELLDALEEKGAAMKKKQDVHKMAESSRALSHLRF